MKEHQTTAIQGMTMKAVVNSMLLRNMIHRLIYKETKMILLMINISLIIIMKRILKSRVTQVRNAILHLIRIHRHRSLMYYKASKEKDKHALNSQFKRITILHRKNMNNFHQFQQQFLHINLHNHSVRLIMTTNHTVILQDDNHAQEEVL